MWDYKTSNKLWMLLMWFYQNYWKLFLSKFSFIMFITNFEVHCQIYVLRYVVNFLELEAIYVIKRVLICWWRFIRFQNSRVSITPHQSQINVLLIYQTRVFCYLMYSSCNSWYCENSLRYFYTCSYLQA